MSSLDGIRKCSSHSCDLCNRFGPWRCISVDYSVHFPLNPASLFTIAIINKGGVGRGRRGGWANSMRVRLRSWLVDPYVRHFMGLFNNQSGRRGCLQKEKEKLSVYGHHLSDRRGAPRERHHQKWAGRTGCASSCGITPAVFDLVRPHIVDLREEE